MNSSNEKFPIKNNSNDTLHYHIGKYYKYWIYNDGVKTKNPNFDKAEENNLSSQILDLKEIRPGSVDFFFEKVRSVLQGSFTVCTVPPSSPGRTTSGIKLVAKKLATSNPNITDGTECLIRTIKIPKLAHGGNRSSTQHIKSIELKDEHLIKNKVVVLLDDVMTTGNSMKACRIILIGGGASTVACLAMAQTIKE